MHTEKNTRTDDVLKQVASPFQIAYEMENAAAFTKMGQNDLPCQE
jgi:hypothetical protein